MSKQQPVTSHHLSLFAKIAPYLIEHPPQEQPRDSASGSILGRHICQSASTTATFKAFIWNPSFNPPRFSTAYLERVHAILFERDLKVQRLQQTLTTIAEAFLAKQDEEVRRNPSRRVIPRHYFSQQPYAGHWYPIVGPHRVMPFVNLAGGCWIENSSIRALYKSTFHEIRKLTRGSRSLVKGNADE